MYHITQIKTIKPQVIRKLKRIPRTVEKQKETKVQIFEI